MSTAELVEVAVPVAVHGRFHYRVPAHLSARAQIGARVLVRFGGRKVTGVIVRAGTPAPDGVRVADLAEVLDGEPALSPELVELCLWIADYYEAPVGEVLRGALPAGSAVSERSVFGLTPAGESIARGEGAALPGRQRAILRQLADDDLPVASANAAMRRVLDELVRDGLVEQRDRRTAARAKLARDKVACLVADLDAARTATARAPKRRALIEVLGRGAPDGVRVDELATAEHGGASALRELVKAGLVRIEERERALEAVEAGAGMPVAPPPVLTGEQEHAVAAITETLRASTEARHGFAPFLLHGVTGSGKTEVYLRVIAEALRTGRTALVLVPEISLTPQLAARFRARFGDLVAILHSGLSEPARLAEWSRLRRGIARIAVGARSAVFAPLTDLAVIVVDEEHDGSFKQEEGVRYHARDVALVRAQKAGAACILGSGTPSLESAAHAERGQYRKLVLSERPMARPMPTVDIIDLKTHLPDDEAFLSAPLRAAITETLAGGDQVILFLNRRGFATFVLCRACGHSFACPNCSVSLTYHRHSDRLSCHYCAHSARVPEACPSCGVAGAIERKGLGTERIAAGVAEAFPSARVARLDRDVASGAKIEAVLSRVARREIDVLVGTQMVTKGHDFPGVTLVGVLCADTGLNLPDFRASERTFQLLAQVSGRAGRGDRPGRVLIQTYRPGASAVVAAAGHDYARFYAAEIEARREHGYPPFGRLILVRLDGADEHEVASASHEVAQACTRAADAVASSASTPAGAAPRIEVLGPVAAPLARLRGRSRWQVWLRGADRHALRWVARHAVGEHAAGKVRVTLDVDPISAM